MEMLPRRSTFYNSDSPVVLHNYPSVIRTSSYDFISIHHKLPFVNTLTTICPVFYLFFSFPLAIYNSLLFSLFSRDMHCVQFFSCITSPLPPAIADDKEASPHVLCESSHRMNRFYLPGIPDSSPDTQAEWVSAETYVF